MSRVLVAVILVSIAVCTRSGEAAPGLLEQTAEEVRRAPTTADTATARAYRLGVLAKLILSDCGPERVDAVLPPAGFAAILERLEARVFDDAAARIDRAMLGLCRAGASSQRLSRVRRVTFKSRSGAAIVGMLVPPERPSKAGFVFGHGGFGTKENWLDVMEAVSRRNRAWALAIDFEGCGESGGCSAWAERIANFSAAMDYLRDACGVERFAAGGHSGGGAWPAACAAVSDARVSTLVLWDCPFDFYDMHVRDGATDPGGNPACLLDRTSRAARGRVTVPAEVEPARGVRDRIDAIYSDIAATMERYRDLARQVGAAQKKRRLAVLHIVAEDVLRPVTDRRMGETYTLAAVPGASAERARFLDRPLAFYASGLFDRSPGACRRWEAEMANPKATVMVERTTHAFERPGRDRAIEATLDWLERHL